MYGQKPFYPSVSVAEDLRHKENLDGDCPENLYSLPYGWALFSASQTRSPGFGVPSCLSGETAATGRTGRQKRIVAGWSAPDASGGGPEGTAWMLRQRLEDGDLALPPEPGFG